MKLASWLKSFLLYHSSSLAELFSGWSALTWGLATLPAGITPNGVFSSLEAGRVFALVAVFVGAEQILAVYLGSRLFRSWSAFHCGVAFFATSIPYALAGRYPASTMALNMFLLNVCLHLQNRGANGGSSG